VLWSSDDCFLHVAILDCNNVRLTLLFLNKSSTALESAMGHSALLATV
tara:strand:+ start:190 stop:333 length:144 start_codon:yes stop_codon:yes gene_type:complete